MKTNLEIFDLGCKTGYEAGLQGCPCPVGGPASLTPFGSLAQSKYQEGVKAGFQRGKSAHQTAKQQILGQFCQG